MRSFFTKSLLESFSTLSLPGFFLCWSEDDKLKSFQPFQWLLLFNSLQFWPDALFKPLQWYIFDIRLTYETYGCLLNINKVYAHLLIYSRVMFNHKREETPIILLCSFKQVWIENSFVAWVT